MTKQLITSNLGNYTFAPGAAGVGTVTLTGIDTITIDKVLLITNVTDNIRIYRTGLPGFGGTIASNVITLDSDTTGMDAGDDLQIYVELPDSNYSNIVNIGGGDSGLLADVLDTETIKRLAVDSRTAREHGAVSAYGLPKVALERILKQYKFNDALLQIAFKASNTGSGTTTTDDPFSLKITSGTTVSTTNTVTTKQNHVHPVGKGLIVKSFVQFDNIAITGNKRCFGLYNDNDGFYIELSDGDIYFVLRKSGSDTKIISNSWSEFSDYPVVVNDKHNLWYIQSEGAGVGNYEIWFNEILVHRQENLGVITSPVINQEDLPLRLENTNTTNTTDVLMQIDGVMIGTEGEESVRITDGKNDALFSQSRRLLTEGFGSPLMEQSMADTLDTITRWQETIVGAASSTQIAETYTLELINTTGATDSIEYKFKELNLRESIGSFAEFEVGAKFGATLQTNNVREWGYLDNSNLNGVFFRVDGSELKFVTMKNGVESVTDITSSMPNSNFHLYKITHLGAGKIAGFIDNTQVIDFSPAAISVVGSAEKQPFVKMYNTAGLAGVPSNCEFHWLALRDLSGTSVTIVGKDENNAFKPVAVSTTGRLLVSQEPPPPIPGETAIAESYIDNSNAIIDNVVTITSGETLTVQGFRAGSAGSGAICSAYVADDGVNPNDLSTPIAISFVTPGNDSQAPNFPVIGDGTRAIILRREPQGGGGARNMYIALNGSETVA